MEIKDQLDQLYGRQLALVTAVGAVCTAMRATFGEDFSSRLEESFARLDAALLATPTSDATLSGFQEIRQMILELQA